MSRFNNRDVETGWLVVYNVAHQEQQRLEEQNLCGVIWRGINNIYTVKSDSQTYTCRIKGKQLPGVVGEYNPLAVGDLVLFTAAGIHSEGQIVQRLPRRNSFQRWNVKGECNQTVVANMDLVICVCSAESPPFRPRFIDRVIACSRGIEVMIVMNKSDILLTEDEYERFHLFSELGYQTMAVSAKTGENVQQLIDKLQGKTVAFVGQSGVGKSTLINRMLGSASNQRTGEVSAKFNRGRHTTNHSIMLEGPGFTAVDTPGVREILVPHGDPHLIADSFPEFREPSHLCEFAGCLHSEEPGCMVKELAEEGLIHPDRYESYLRMLASLDERVPQWQMDSMQANGKTVTTSKSGKFQRKNKLHDSRDGVGKTVQDHVEEDS